MREKALFLVLVLCGYVACALPGLTISGNKILDFNGKEVVLRGVDRSGAEYMCIDGSGVWDGPANQSSIDYMKSWNINVVRIPLNEDCWLGINGVPFETSGPNYIKAIIEFVGMLGENDIYVIVDLHWAAPGSILADKQWPMPNIDHSPDFWRSVADAFRSNPTVIFDLYNEPFPLNGTWSSDAAWRCWKNGNCPGLGYQAAGMDDLVSAVRGTGATNIIMLGGLDWANSLDGWINYLPIDPGIAASWHSYNFNACNNKTCWDQYLPPVAATHPIIAGEIGEEDCAHGYVDELMPYLDQYNISYLGWTWNTGNCSEIPALLSSYDGTPTNYGIGLKEHLAKFNSTRN